MKIVYIMRGIPGSGKSTIAKELAGTIGIVHSVDEYFYENGEYIFDVAKVPEFCQKSLEAFSESVKNGIPIVVCDRCNIKKADWEPYAKVATCNGYVVAIVVLPRPSVEISMRRNIHNVPEERIRRMIEEWED